MQIFMIGNYINAPEGTFIGAKDFPHIDPSKITILSTGSQGEPLAALSRIADGTHKTIKIIPGDTIVFSSTRTSDCRQGQGPLQAGHLSAPQGHGEFDPGKTYDRGIYPHKQRI